MEFKIKIERGGKTVLPEAAMARLGVSVGDSLRMRAHGGNEFILAVANENAPL